MQHHPPKKSGNNILIILTLLIVTLEAGCGESPKSKPATPAGSKPVQKQTVVVSAPTPTVVPKEEEKKPLFAYNAGGRRDPFAPIIVKASSKGRMGDRPPLERYNITEFKLTGIIWGGFGYNAMFEAPDGKGYFIRTGTVVGPNQGVVKKITANRLIIEERYKDYTGQTQSKEIIVELRKTQEETP